MGEFLEFVWLPTFERSAAGLLDEDAYAKDVRDDLTEGHRAELRQLARTIKKGGR